MSEHLIWEKCFKGRKE